MPFVMALWYTTAMKSSTLYHPSQAHWSLCNLAMLRLTKYKQGRAGFDVDAYVCRCAVHVDASRRSCRLLWLPNRTRYAVDARKPYPRTFPLDLGGLLMSMGIPYDSNEGRLYAEAIAALHFYAATEQSIKMASKLVLGELCAQRWYGAGRFDKAQ